MAQAATMGPPLSPREPRRSGRRSIPSTSTSASKSPDSDPAPKQKEISQRPPLSSNNSGGRQKRLKQEDYDDPPDDHKNGSASSTPSGSSTHGTSNGRNKRKAKEIKQPADAVANEGPPGLMGHPLLNAPEEEEQGITRCVCGSTGEDDPDAGEFMVQCETCKVWQHGLCMGYESEDQLHEDDYYCELCRPGLHSDILKKRSRRPRQTSTNFHHNPTSATSRVSRSHSPSTLLKQPSKRRNTMNSRDAAFDESLKEIIEATAAEAAAHHDNISVTSTGNHDQNGNSALDEDVEPALSSRKKRKRTEDDGGAKKRTRSASCASDHLGSIVAPDDALTKFPPTSAPVPRPSGRSNKRSSRKIATAPPLDSLALMDVEDGAPTSKRQGNSRAKGLTAKRPPASHSASHGPSSAPHDHGTRRNQTTSVAAATSGSNQGESSRAYRNSHAYVVSQQPLFTSWNLPDYLAHLEEMLPTDTPRPLEVPSGSSLSAGNVSGGRGESLDRTVERGVKVKWPSKRTSVGDMNKRVRALVEWVGREQAAALDRMRRRDALGKALKEELRTQQKRREAEKASGDPAALLDRLPPDPVYQVPDPTGTKAVNYDNEETQSSATMKMMEELMEELIGFQERFGPAAKSRERRPVPS